MEIKFWVKAAREHKGLNQTQLGELVSRSKANVGHWETGKHEPSYSQLTQISKLTGFPMPNQLQASEDGEITLPSDPGGGRESTDLVIPEYDTGGAMGNGLVLADQPGVIKEWRVSERWAQENIHRVTSYKNLAIVTGFGPSMQPLFNSGDPLLVDRGVTRADIDGIYFFRVGDEGFVKQIQRIPTADGLILRAKSYNPLYDPFDIIKGMDFEVFARIVKVWRGEDF